MIKPLVILAAAALATATGIAWAQQPPPAAAPARVPPARGPESALALELAQPAISSCTTNGYTVAVSVVDSAGVLKLFLAKDGASKGAVESSTKKATTALAMKAPTSEVAEKMKTDQALTAKVNADSSLFVRAGGVPLKVGSDFIGAVGVGGAPGGEKDEACAIAGIDKVKARLK